MFNLFREIQLTPFYFFIAIFLIANFQLKSNPPPFFVYYTIPLMVLFGCSVIGLLFHLTTNLSFKLIKGLEIKVEGFPQEEKLKGNKNIVLS